MTQHRTWTYLTHAYLGSIRARRTLMGSLQNPNLDLDVRLFLQEKLDWIDSYILRIENLFAPYGGIR
jgi:hypothetical protein